MVLLVDLQVLGEVIDTPCQQRNLDLRRTGVVRVRAIFIYNSLRVVHEVLSYASKFDGREPAWRMPTRDDSKVAFYRCFSVCQDQPSAFRKKAKLHASGDNGFDLYLDQPLGIEQCLHNDHGCCRF